MATLKIHAAEFGAQRRYTPAIYDADGPIDCVDGLRELWHGRTESTKEAALAAAQRYSTETVPAIEDDLDYKADLPEEWVYYPESATWHADDGNAEIEIVADSGREAAEEYVDGGDWGDRNSTSWVTVRVWREGVDQHGDAVQYAVEDHKIILEAEEPKCDHEDGHDWQDPAEIVGGCRENPGVHSHGGGVRIEEVCMHCGCSRVTDTWAQDPTDGEQWLRSVEYTPGKYAEEVSRDDAND